jgi:hypothetical protein
MYVDCSLTVSMNGWAPLINAAFESVVVFLSVLVANQTLADGRSKYVQP